MNACPHWREVPDDILGIGTCAVPDSHVECPPETPNHCSINDSFLCIHEGSRSKGSLYGGCMLERQDQCRGPDCGDYEHLPSVPESPGPGVHPAEGQGPDGDAAVGAGSGSGGDAASPDAAGVDLVPDVDVPTPDPAAPCPHGQPAIDYVVAGLARNVFNKGIDVPIVVVVCRESQVGECPSACPFGMYSRSILEALSKVPKSSIIAPH